MQQLSINMRVWKNGIEEMTTGSHTPKTVFWFHNESTFYANDRREVFWVHGSEEPIPKTKGEGATLMVADFVSADYGWLISPDGLEEAREYFRAGANRDGYFTNERILDQAAHAREILKKHFPGDIYFPLILILLLVRNKADIQYF